MIPYMILLNPVSQLELPETVVAQLEAHGMHYLYDLVQLSEAHLARLPGLDISHVRAIRDALAKSDLSLGLQLDGWMTSAYAA